MSILNNYFFFSTKWGILVILGVIVSLIDNENNNMQLCLNLYTLAAKNENLVKFWITIAEM